MIQNMHTQIQRIGHTHVRWDGAAAPRSEPAAGGGAAGKDGEGRKWMELLPQNTRNARDRSTEHPLPCLTSAKLLSDSTFPRKKRLLGLGKKAKNRKGR